MSPHPGYHRVMATVMRTYQYRLYPTRAQAEQLARCFGHARFVWNWALGHAHQGLAPA